MKTFIKNFIYDKKELFIISFIQFLYGISELFFSLTAGLSISSFIVSKKVVLFNLEFTNFDIFILLILSIILRTFFSYLASKCSSTSVYKLWNLIIEKAFFVIRNGHININQIGSFISLIQLESYVGLNSFYYTFYQILGDLLLIFFGVIFLAVTNLSATIYTFITIIFFYLIFLKSIYKTIKNSGKKQKFFLDKTISLYRNQIAFRDIYWIRNRENNSYRVMNDNAESLKYYSQKHIILDEVSRVIIESFGVIVLISYPLFSLATSKSNFSTEGLIVSFALWTKLFITFYKAASRFKTISFNYDYAKSMMNFISKFETMNDYQKKGFQKLDAFKEKNSSKKNSTLLYVKAFQTENKNGPRFDFPEITISKGKKYTLIGKSGSGKSTLIKTILNLPSLRHELGKIEFNLNTRKISYISTEHELGYGRITDLIDFHKSFKFEKRLMELVKKLKLSGKIEDIESFKILKLDNLSSGQKMRVRLLTELLLDPDLIIIDESFSSLDKRTLKSCIDAIDDTTSLLVIDHSSNLKDLITYEITQIN